MTPLRRCRLCRDRKPLDDYDTFTTCRTCAVKCPVCHGGPACDRHQVPPVCVCDAPDPDGLGQCRNTGCKLAYLPNRARYAEARQAWRQQLGAAETELAATR